MPRNPPSRRWSHVVYVGVLSSPMTESRRELFARLIRDAGRTAAPIVQGRIAEIERAIDVRTDEIRPRATPVVSPASTSTLVEAARELKVPVADTALSERLRVSLPLTIAPRGAPPTTAAGDQAGPSALTLSLSEPLLVGTDLPPRSGLLRLASDAHGAWRLHMEPEAEADGHTAHSQLGAGDVRLLASRELLLPREWSDEVNELGLDDDGRAAWGRLRATFAAAQGRELYGESNGVVSHRLLGLPDDRSGSMPLECELRAMGVFEQGVEPFAHPLASEVASRCSHWRLLLQLSADEWLGWRWGTGEARLYVWTTLEDMQVGRFERAQTIVR